MKKRKKSKSAISLLNNPGRIRLVALAFLAAAIVTACTPNKQKEEESDANEPSSAETIANVEAAYQVDTLFSRQLNDVYVAYLTLKEALVDSDPEASRTAAAGVGKALAMVNPDLLKGSARNDWNTFIPEIGRSLRSISTASTLEEQRLGLSVLSEGLWKVISAFGLAKTEVYRDYCPMALNNKGAYWLTSTPEIRNPYFGASMLDCGYARQKMK